jgi:hypothetical protein
MRKDGRSEESPMATLVARYPANSDLIDASRRVLSAAFPGTTEEADPKAGLISYSFGPGYKGVVATLILSKGGVKIGIPYGATLEDPAGLLEGSGKVHRYIPVTSLSALTRPGVNRLLASNLQAWKRRGSGA